MDFLVAIINAIKSGKKVVKNARLGIRAVSSVKKSMEILKGFFIGWLKGLALYVVVVVLVVSIVIGGIKSVFNFFRSKGGDNYNPSKVAALISDKEAQELIKDGSSINPKKLTQYGNVEDNSYPKYANVKMHIIDDGRDTVSDYKLDLTKTSYQFRTPWQLVAGIDVAKDIFTDGSDLYVVNSAKSSLVPSFEWGYDKYTKDVTDSRKEYVIETTQDKDQNGNLKGRPIEIKNTKDLARQIDVTKKYPLPFADTVTTPLKKFTYHFTLDNIAKDDPWSSPIVVGTPKQWDEQVQDGYEDDKSKPIYGDDTSTPIYGDDYSNPIRGYVKYNTFETLNVDVYGSTFNVKASLNGDYDFSGSELFSYDHTEGDYYVFTDYWESLMSIRIPIGKVSTSEQFYFKDNTSKFELSGNYEQKVIGYGKKIVAYEQKPKYKTVHHVETNYKIVKQKVVEDQISYVDEALMPQQLIGFVDQIGISKADLALVHDLLENMPNAADITDDLQNIIEGNYLKEGNNSLDGWGIGGADLSSEIPLFIQWDKRWGNIAYGRSGTIATSGCGPTSMAMVITGLCGNVNGIDKNGDGIVDPSETASYSVSSGFRVENQGTSWGFFANIGSKAGLKVTQYTPSDYQEVLKHLQAGHPVIASMTPGDFTRGGHFIVLTGVAPDGKIRVNDPNSEDKSKKTWDFNSTIVAQAAQFWVCENPNLFAKGGEFTLSAYGGVHDSMQGGGTTADGTKLDGLDFTVRIIAVDPKVIKLGSKVYIELPESKRYQFKNGQKYDLNGWYTARDTGGAIKGNRIDLYMGFGGAEDTKRCYDFGMVSNVKVRWRK